MPLRDGILRTVQLIAARSPRPGTSSSSPALRRQRRRRTRSLSGSGRRSPWGAARSAGPPAGAASRLPRPRYPV